MKQLIACKKSGVILLEEVEMPELQENGVLVRTLYSVISAGTERAVISRYREIEGKWIYTAFPWKNNTITGIWG